MVKFGQLFLQEGMWNDEEIISKEWVRESTLDHMPDDVQFVYSVKPSGGYGYLWWIYDGFYTASGLHGQRIIVNPGNEYVVVFTSLDVTQEGADNLHRSLLEGNFAGWEEPMTDFYKRSAPYLVLLLLFFATINFAFLKYGINQRISSEGKDRDIVLTSLGLSAYTVFVGFLATLSIIFVVLDLFFAGSRGILFPKFQWLTWLMLIVFTGSVVVLDREWLKYRHNANLAGMLKFIVPKSIFFVILTVFLFFDVYLKMVADFSA